MHSYISGHYVVSVPWLLWILLPWTWKYRYLLEIIVAFPLYIYPEVGLLDHMVVLFSISWGTAILFSVVAVPVDISTNSVQVFSPHPSQHCCPFDKSHPNRCDMIVGFFFFFFRFAFSWWLVMLSVFSCTCWPFICLLWEKMSNQIIFICYYLFFFSELYELLIYFGY